jgi:hypothetical protein
MSNSVLPENQTLFEVMNDWTKLMPETLEKRVVLAFMTEGGPNSLVADSMLKSEGKVKDILSKHNAKLIYANPNDMPNLAMALGLTEVPVLFFFEKGNGQPRYALYGYFDNMINKFETAADKAYKNKK